MAHLTSQSSGRTAVEHLEIADNFWSRFIGLQFRRELLPGTGLLIVPCRSVHTCFLRFAIDVVYLDAEGKVLSITRSLRPWRLDFGHPEAKMVLELPAGTADFAVGDVLRWD